MECSHPCAPLTRTIRAQLFYSFFKTLVGKEIAVELKNDVRHRAPSLSRVRSLAPTP